MAVHEEAITRQQGRAEVMDELRKEDDSNSKQELTHYYKNIFTLKSGIQIEICTREKLDLKSAEKFPSWRIFGFILNPLLVKKEIKIVREDVSAVEMIKDPCIAQVIPWPESEDIMSDAPVPADQVEERDGLIQRKKDKHQENCICGCYLPEHI